MGVWFARSTAGRVAIAPAVIPRCASQSTTLPTVGKYGPQSALVDIASICGPTLNIQVHYCNCTRAVPRGHLASLTLACSRTPRTGTGEIAACSGLPSIAPSPARRGLRPATTATMRRHGLSGAFFENGKSPSPSPQERARVRTFPRTLRDRGGTAFVKLVPKTTADRVIDLLRSPLSLCCRVRPAMNRDDEENDRRRFRDRIARH